MQSPLAFIRHLNDPETGQPFVLNAAEALFLRHAFKTGSDGRLLYPELLYSCPKKSGKTTFAALLLLYCTLNFGKFGEGYACVAGLSCPVPDLEVSLTTSTRRRGVYLLPPSALSRHLLPWPRLRRSRPIGSSSASRGRRLRRLRLTRRVRLAAMPAWRPSTNYGATFPNVRAGYGTR
jgi:hypothetical protein